MAVELTLLGALIYGAMLAYLGAAIALACKWRKPGKRLYVLGFALALGAFLLRWHTVRHVPLQNLFEVFLCLGMLCYPLSAFCERFLGVRLGAADALVGLVVLFPAGFVFSAQPRGLPPALQTWLFAPHVGAYMLAYVVLLKAGIQAGRALFGGMRAAEGRRVSHEEATYRLVRMGLPLLTLGLVLGAVWGKAAWGDYWHWDPKELWALATWLVYVAYLQVREVFGTRHVRVNSLIALGGVAVIGITLLWANLGRLFAGLHSYAM